ncbi:hypothetical protein D7W79_01245 [Corallococcus exercitus]|uniref:hypothetical protein n=1 Tax=Corallococcus exercitus TaxID=2316736 RepID=UPI000EA3658E|nr:hypothetical protein [Corallococcus exercitus]RKG82971.1 hypothetical protein D7W79_01245 [Corallococcus exercitus]
MATAQDFRNVLRDLRTATRDLPAETGGFLGFGKSKIYNRATARMLGNQLVAICRQCIDALEDVNVTLFKFRTKAEEIDALLNIQMVTANKQQIQDLKDTALQLKQYCLQTPSIDRLDITSTLAQWDGVKAIDLVLEELAKNPDNLSEDEVAGRAQLIINNAGNAADPLDTGWNPSKRANIQNPLDRVPEASRDIVGLGKTTVATDPGSLGVCHGTAAGMLNILGRKHRTYQAGGKGRVLRKEARDLALRLLKDKSKLYLIWFKCTAQMDGHSFMLCMNHSGSVTRAESWANPSGNGLFVSLQEDKKQRSEDTLSGVAAANAVRKIFSADPDERTQGYETLAQAYSDCVRYELRMHDEHAPNHECDDDCRADDAEISIVVTARQLTTPKTVKNRLEVLASVYDAVEPL